MKKKLFCGEGGNNLTYVKVTGTLSTQKAQNPCSHLTQGLVGLIVN